MSEEGDKPASHKPGHGGHEEEHEEHVNHEAWVIPYADMLTLLMALFLMLWATSSVDQQKFAALAESLRDAFGSGTGEEAAAIAQGNPGILDGQVEGIEGGDRNDNVSPPDRAEMISAAMADAAPAKTAAEQALAREQKRAQDEAKESQTLADVQKRISDHAEAKDLLEALQFERQERGLVVTVVADNVLFDPGSAELKGRGQELLAVVAEAVKNVPNPLMVEGHTDNTPISTSQYPSNWELSASRGTSVLRYFADRVGIPSDRIGSAGYGDARPVASNDSAAGRSANRRVEIVIMSTLANSAS